MNSAALRKAAVLVASLDRQTADRLLEQMPDEQAGRVRQWMVELDEIDPEEQRRVIDEFFRSETRATTVQPPAPSRPSVMPGHDPLRPLANYQSVNDGGVELELMSTRGISSRPPFRFLHDAEPQTLAPLLVGEHPQTIAVVLSHLAPDQAGEVLAPLPPELQVDVMRRLAALEEADPQTLREVERGLESRMQATLDENHRCHQGMSAIQDILQAARPGTKRTILANLAKHDEPLATRLHGRSRTFADCLQLDAARLAILVEEAGLELVQLALATAPASVAERFAAVLPQSAGRPIALGIEQLGPVRLSDIDGAQQEIASLLTALERQGRMDVPF